VFQWASLLLAGKVAQELAESGWVGLVVLVEAGWVAQGLAEKTARVRAVWAVQVQVEADLSVQEQTG
jgi:predicted DNA-binding transcriptional regulator